MVAKLIGVCIVLSILLGVFPAIFENIPSDCENKRGYDRLGNGANSTGWAKLCQNAATSIQSGYAFWITVLLASSSTITWRLGILD